jgi:hypothetical protein
MAGAATNTLGCDLFAERNGKYFDKTRAGRAEISLRDHFARLHPAESTFRTNIKLELIVHSAKSSALAFYQIFISFEAFHRKKKAASALRILHIYA